MFEASVNKQFKSRFAVLNGVVNMGPISVLRRVFNGHSIDSYVLSNNLEEQLVVMRKKEFEALCKYIKVDIERTSNIPRAKLIKEKGMRGIDLNPGSSFNPCALLPYVDVSASGYANYLNNIYLSQIQPYSHMILRGMNFSHYEVIGKAMSSSMANAINMAYQKHGANINNVLSKRSYNAEEYEVALLGVANLGIDKLTPKYFKALCANDGSGAKYMKSKLDKYLDTCRKEMNSESVRDAIPSEKVSPYLYMNCIEKFVNSYPNTFRNLSNTKSSYGTPCAVFDYKYNKAGLFIPIYVYSVPNNNSMLLIICPNGENTTNGVFEKFSYNAKNTMADISQKIKECLKRLEQKLNVLENEEKSQSEFDKARLKKIDDKKKELMTQIEYMEKHLPIINDDTWYSAELSAERSMVAIQKIEYNNYYPSVIFSYSDDNSINKSVYHLVVDMVKDRFPGYVFLRIYPYLDREIEDYETIVYSLSEDDRRTDILWDGINKCIREVSSCRCEDENKVAAKYKNYRYIDSGRILEDLYSELGDIEMGRNRLEQRSFNIKTGRPISNTNQKSYSDYRGKPESLPNTVNKDSKRTLFDNQDPSDFSQKTVETSKKKYTEEETAKALEELSQLFQFI